MRTTTLRILLAGLLVATTSAYRDGPSRRADPPTSCLSYKDSDSCLAGGCSWCTGSLLGDGCLSTDVAKLVPDTVATCELPPEAVADVAKPAPGPGPTPGPGGGCMDAKDKKACLKTKDVSGGGCAWCATQWQGETCMGEQQAKYMPGNKCKFPKPSATSWNLLDALLLPFGSADKAHPVDSSSRPKDGAADMPYGPGGGGIPFGPGGGGGGIPFGPGGGDSPFGPAGGCMAAKNKKACMKAKDFMGGCAWCEQGWQGGSCVAETQAKFMPQAKCHFKDHKHGCAKHTASASVAMSLALPISTRKAVNPAPGPGPTPGPGGGCMGAKTKKACLKAKDFSGGGCAWCASQWQGESCMGEQQAKVIPGNKCKFPKPSASLALTLKGAPLRQQPVLA